MRIRMPRVAFKCVSKEVIWLSGLVPAITHFCHIPLRNGLGHYKNVCSRLFVLEPFAILTFLKLENVSARCKLLTYGRKTAAIWEKMAVLTL